MTDTSRPGSTVVECAIVDGAVDDGAPERQLVLSCRPMAPSEDGRAPRLGHTGMCISTISAVEAAARFRLFPVFSRDGEDVPVDAVLDGLRASVDARPAVICMPWTIAQTRLAADFEAVCSAAEAAGAVLVAAWAPDVDKPIPASFRSVVAVLGRSDPAMAFGWDEKSCAVMTAFSSSRGTALVSGLAAAFARVHGPGGRDAFVDALRRMPPVPAAVVQDRSRFPRGFDPSRLIGDVAAAWRALIGGGRQ